MGTATDPKFLLIARLSGQNVAAVVAVWAMLLERASEGAEGTGSGLESGRRGCISGFDCDAADVILGLEAGAARAVLEALTARGLLCGDRVTNWDKRQPRREDPSTERVRRFRERQRRERAAAGGGEGDAGRRAGPDLPGGVLAKGDGGGARADGDFFAGAVPGPDLPGGVLSEGDGGNAGKRTETPEERRREEIPLLSSLRSESMSPSGAAARRRRAEGGLLSRRPPSVEEVRAYCAERGNGVNPGHFVDYYAAQGWRLSNGRVMRDWKAAVRNWEHRDAARSAGQDAARSGRLASGGGRLSDAEARQRHNDEVCRQVAAELEAQGGAF